MATIRGTTLVATTINCGHSIFLFNGRTSGLVYSPLCSIIKDFGKRLLGVLRFQSRARLSSTLACCVEGLEVTLLFIVFQSIELSIVPRY